MQTSKFWLLSLLCLAMIGTAAAGDKKRTILALDNCDPSDKGFDASGGCKLEKGDVTLEEFNKLVPQGGHPSWHFEPSYITIKEGQTLKVKNRGGRTHTFTEVEEFGGGFIAPLNAAVVTPPAPECQKKEVTDASTIPPGGMLKIKEDEAGLELYQCCIHPWMRVAVRVREHNKNDDNHHDDNHHGDKGNNNY